MALRGFLFLAFVDNSQLFQTRLENDRSGSSDTVDRLVESVPFNRFPAGFPDEMLDFRARQADRSLGPRHVNDLFFNHRPIQVISPEVKSDLGCLGADHDPIGLDVGEIVQQETADCDGLKIQHGGRGRQMIQLRMGRMEGQGDETLKALSLVLQLPQPDQVVDPLFHGFNMPVEHGGIGLQSAEVHPPGDFEPAFARHLVVTNEVAGALGKDLGPSPGATVHSRLPKSPDGLIDGQLGPAGQEIQLNHGKGLEMNFGEARLQTAEQVGIVGEGKIGMQATHDVKLGHGLGIAHRGMMKGLLQRTWCIHPCRACGRNRRTCSQPRRRWWDSSGG